MEHTTLLLSKTVIEMRHINACLDYIHMFDAIYLVFFAYFHFVLIFYVTEAGKNSKETTTTDLVGKILLLGIFSGSNMSCNY